MFGRTVLIVRRSGEFQLVTDAEQMAPLTADEVALRVAVVIPDECFGSPLVDAAMFVASDNVLASDMTVHLSDAESGRAPANP